MMTHKLEKIDNIVKKYELKESCLYKLTTKEKMEKILFKKFKILSKLTKDSNYHIFCLEQKNGKKREIQVPKPGLLKIHKRIANLFYCIEVPDYLHSGVKGKSYITNAKAHLGNYPVLKIDISDFYNSISKKSIFNFFRIAMKAGEEIAGVLAGLCSYAEHLPTGSQISMPLSFFLNKKMFDELNNLSRKNNIAMSLYVDDLTFSGDNVNELFLKQVKRIIVNSGFNIKKEKTRLYGRNDNKLITGVIVKGDNIKVSNKQKKLIFNTPSKKTEKALIGRLHAAGNIEPFYKDLAKNPQWLF